MLTVKLRPRLRVKGCPKDIEKRLPVPLAAAGMLVQKEAQVLLGVQGPAGRAGEGWPTYFNLELVKWVRASVPRNPPHRQTGGLQDSVHRVMEKKATIHIVAGAKNPRTGRPYAADLEYGRKKAGPRPFMRPSLYKCIDRIARMFSNFLGA